MRRLATLSFLILGTAPFIHAGTVGGTPAPPVAAPAVTKVLDLFDRLRAAQDKQDKDGAPKRVAFNLNENEINEYLRYTLKTTPGPGWTH